MPCYCICGDCGATIKWIRPSPSWFLIIIHALLQFGLVWPHSVFLLSFKD